MPRTSRGAIDARSQSIARLTAQAQHKRMSRITTTFDALKARGRKALIPFITAGDPEPALTVPLMHGLVEAGADVIELGVPFSDPMADGPVIQRSSERALTHGVGLSDILKMVKEFRVKDAKTPIVLMGYANPVEQMGPARFAEEAKAAGVDGVLVVDYPPEECADFAATVREAGIDMIFLLSPTSSAERIAKVAELASGYIYYVSLAGVTGAANIDTAQVQAVLARIKEKTPLPVGVGFGIRDAATAQRIAAFADAVVVGSRLVQESETSPRGQLVDNVRRLASSFRAAMDETHS
jgi:tryptophan synthase alpha chain